MNTRKTILLRATSIVVAALMCSGPAFAQPSMQNDAAFPPANSASRPHPANAMNHSADHPASSGGVSVGTTGSAAASQKQEKGDAQQLVDEALSVVNTMKKDPQVAKLMQKAKGLYVVPEFGRGAFIVGGRGGAGLVMTHKPDGSWSDPAFYDFGAISVGAQVGGAGGAVAFLLMKQDAVDAFKSGNKFSLNAGAGLSIVTYSADAQASWGKGDIILWSNTKGAYVGATISVTDVNWDDDNNRNYYGKNVDATKIFQGKVTAENGSPAKLKAALPS